MITPLIPPLPPCPRTLYHAPRCFNDIYVCTIYIYVYIQREREHLYIFFASARSFISIWNNETFDICITASSPKTRSFRGPGGAFRGLDSFTGPNPLRGSWPLWSPVLSRALPCCPVVFRPLDTNVRGS